MKTFPWTGMESYETSRQLARLVQRITKRHRRRLPATMPQLRDASSRIGGKLARSSVQLNTPTLQLLDRAKALHAARRAVQIMRRTQRLVDHHDPEIAAAIEIGERVADLISRGR